jgi:protein tyrosine phosphatase type IVA
MESLQIKPTFIQQKNYRFLIIDTPKNENLHLYLEEFKKYNVKHLVRVCFEQKYDHKLVENKKIKFYDLPFEGGNNPPKEIIIKWLQIVEEAFKNYQNLAINCVTGRAPI